jgi:hypothetical protein
MDNDKINLQKTLFAMLIIAHLTGKPAVVAAIRKNMEYVG